MKRLRVACLLATLALAACEAPPPALDRLSIALPAVPHGGLVHIAAAKGYFAEEGLEMTIVPHSHGKAAIEDVLRGRTELAAAAEVVAVPEMMQGSPVAIVANMLSSTSDTVVVARRDRGIERPRDLAGRRVGVTLGTSGEYFLWAFLIRHKMAPDSVTLVDLPPAQIPAALASGAIDATATWHPIVPAARAALGDNAVSFSGEDAYTQTFVVVARSEVLRERPAAIRKLVRALLKAEHLSRSQPDDALELVARGINSESRVLRPVWKDYRFQVGLQQSQLITLEDEARWAMARGYAIKGPVPNFLPYLYLDALLAVEPERVTVARP